VILLNYEIAKNIGGIMHVNKFKMKILYLPLILVEAYLILTLLLYQFGPIAWGTKNVLDFWLYISIYHISFIVGYLLFAKKFKISLKDIEKSNKIKSFIVKYMWIFLSICAVLTLIKSMGFLNRTDFIPWNLPAEFIKGLQNPAEQYVSKFAAAGLNNYTGNKITSGILALFAFIVSSIVPICVFLWERIKLSQKIFFFAIVFFDFATFVSVGTNKGIFDLLFIFAAALSIDLVANFKEKKFKQFLKDKKALVGVTVFLLFFSMWFFSWTMQSRVGSIAIYTANLTDDVTVYGEESPDNPGDKIETKTESLTKNLLYGLSSYVCQGYYGMSLSLGEKFTSTYGIGNSSFLTSNFKYFFGIDVEHNTYQAKISDRWGQYTQWHSFYSYMANDFSFPGVAFIMFLLGASLAAIYKDAVYGKNIIAQCLLPVFVILFLYIPANNQIFSFMQSFCTFFELIILWYVFRKHGIKHIRLKKV